MSQIPTAELYLKYRHQLENKSLNNEGMEDILSFLQVHYIDDYDDLKEGLRYFFEYLLSYKYNVNGYQDHEELVDYIYTDLVEKLDDDCRIYFQVILYEDERKLLEDAYNTAKEELNLIHNISEDEEMFHILCSTEYNGYTKINYSAMCSRLEEWGRRYAITDTAKKIMGKWNFEEDGENVFWYNSCK